MISQSDPEAHAAWLVLEGRLSVVIDGQEVASLGPEELVGEMLEEENEAHDLNERQLDEITDGLVGRDLGDKKE